MSPVNVKTFGAVGNGTTDDTLSLQKAIASKVKVLISDAGKTYLISDTLKFLAGQRLSFAGSKVKKAPTMTAHVAAVHLLGGNYVEDFGVDGNRLGGAQGLGLVADGAGNFLRNCTAWNLKHDGFTVQSGDATFDFCRASDIDDGAGAGGSASGFVGVGVMRCVRCSASLCARGGFSAWGDGCYIDGHAERCGTGVNVSAGGGDYGQIDHLVCTDSRYHDAYFDGAKGWTINHLESRNAGKTSHNGSASGCQMNDCDEFSIGTLVVIAPSGYGLALAAGSSRNRIGSLFVDQVGGWDSDPGLHFSGGACGNHIGDAYLRGTTYGVIIGEGIQGSNDDNHIAALTAVDIPYGALRIDRGKFNKVDQIFARGCYTTASTNPGLIDFLGSSDNVVGFVDQRSTATKPKYVVHFDAQASGNHVLDGFGRDYVTAAVLDENGGNKAVLR